MTRSISVAMWAGLAGQWVTGLSLLHPKAEVQVPLWSKRLDFMRLSESKEGPFFH